MRAGGSRAPSAAIMAVLSVAALLASIACKQPELQWQLDGTVTRGSARMQTKLQSVTTGLHADGGVYLGGYVIDAENVNHPTIAFVSSDFDDPVYWSRENSVQQFFLRRGKVNVLLASGKAFERHEANWAPNNLTFKPWSLVIESNEPVVACNPAPLRMSSSERGSCYSPTVGWSVDINWRETPPAICDDELTVVETRQGVVWARRLRVEDGVELRAVQLRALPSEACAVRF